MSYLSKEKFAKEMAAIRRDNISNERKRLLKEERTKYNRKHTKPSTSKLILWTAIILCVETLLFCQVAFLMTMDTSFLYVLAGIPATLVPTILSYYNKSKYENTSGGIVYETAMHHLNADDAEG